MLGVVCCVIPVSAEDFVPGAGASGLLWCRCNLTHELGHEQNHSSPPRPNQQLLPEVFMGKGGSALVYGPGRWGNAGRHSPTENIQG